MPDFMQILVVIPTYNEVANVAPLSREVLACVPGAEILFVDDSSPDGTAEEVSRLAGADSRIRLLERPGKLGLGTAYLAGFRYALERACDVTVTMDGDLSHHPRHLTDLLSGLELHDVMVGSRYVRGGGIRNWSLHRRLLSRFANWYARFLLSVPVRDCTSGFRGYRLEALRKLPLDAIRSSGYSFLEEIIHFAHRNGLRIGEVPIVFEERRAGRSKISKKEIFRAAAHVLRLRFSSFGHGPGPEGRSLGRDGR